MSTDRDWYIRGIYLNIDDGEAGDKADTEESEEEGCI